MSLSNDIPTNLRVPSQYPLDAKLYALSEFQLGSLGINSNLAYTYYKGMRVYCANERTIWEWRQPNNPGETGLLPSHFVYPTGLIVNDIDYGDQEYNFFPVLQASDIVIPTVPVYKVSNVGDGAGVYKDTTGLVHNFKTLISSNSSVIITENATTIDLKSTGGGTSINLQKIISTDYILSDVDDKHTIFIDNGSDKVFITIPLGLKPNFFCVFLQQGTGEVMFTNDVGVTVFTPIGYYIKGQYYWAHLEKVEGQEVYHLLATVNPI